MTALLRALRGEVLKTRRTLSLWLCFIGPLALAVLVFFMAFQMGERMFDAQDDAWRILAQNYLVLWTLLALPLFVTLEMGLLGALEHGNKAWKQLFAQPLPRWAIYTAKEIVGLALIGLSTLVGVGAIALVGRILNLLRPGTQLATPVPWGMILSAAVLAYAASWLIISLHLWVSLHWSSFVLAMAVGIVMTVAGAIVFESEWGAFYPWTLPGLVALGQLDQKMAVMPLIVGLAGGIVVAAAGAWELARRDVL